MQTSTRHLFSNACPSKISQSSGSSNLVMRRNAVRARAPLSPRRASEACAPEHFSLRAASAGGLTRVSLLAPEACSNGSECGESGGCGGCESCESFAALNLDGGIAQRISRSTSRKPCQSADAHGASRRVRRGWPDLTRDGEKDSGGGARVKRERAMTND